jgi:nuclear pore complex protein Nup205
MPALQVVNGMLARFGTKHKTIATQVRFSPESCLHESYERFQVLEFLSSHRDTIVILLKTDTEPTPLSVIEEMHLLVSVCAGVLPLVPPSELVRSAMSLATLDD